MATLPSSSRQIPSVSESPNPSHPVHRGQAERSASLLHSIFHKYAGPPFSIRFWDDSRWHTDGKETSFEIFLRSCGAWEALSTTPDEISLGSKYISGEIDIEGDLFLALRALPSIKKALDSHLSSSIPLLQAATRQLVQRVSRELHWGSVHSKRRDAASIAHHYDKPAEFYELFLGPSMVYSCAYFRDWGDDLYTAQRNKLDLICRKLDLRPEDRFMDIGCGWGSLVIHAVRNYEVSGHGISLSKQQVSYANHRIEQETLQGTAHIQLSDFRDFSEFHAPFHKLASVGMCEHVGQKHIDAYFREAYRSLLPGGLFLNHGITRSVQSPRTGPSFIDEYVFPDGELLTLTEMVRAAEDAGFEVRDVEDLREHYEETLHRWVDSLCEKEQEAITLTDYETFRIWRLYMTSSAEAFQSGDIAIHQLLLSKNAAGQSSASKVREWCHEGR